MGNGFKQGERVSVPLHGQGVVQSVEHVHLPGGGEETCYVIVLRGRKGGRLVIPERRAADYGLRRPMSAEEAEGVMAVLAEPVGAEFEAEQPSQPDLYRELKEELRNGRAESLARVVRGLYIYSLSNAITDVHLKELERHSWSELVDELAEAETSTKVTAQKNIRSTLKAATPKEFLR